MPQQRIATRLRSFICADAPPPQIDVALVIIVNVQFTSVVIVQYRCLFPTIVLAQNFVVVIRDRPFDCFRASPYVAFRQINVVTVNVVQPRACSAY